MSGDANTSTQVTAPAGRRAGRRRWWQEREMVALAVAAVLLVAGLIVEWTIHLEPVSLALFWATIVAQNRASDTGSRWIVHSTISPATSSTAATANATISRSCHHRRRPARRPAGAVTCVDVFASPLICVFSCDRTSRQKRSAADGAGRSRRGHRQPSLPGGVDHRIVGHGPIVGDQHDPGRQRIDVLNPGQALDGGEVARAAHTSAFERAVLGTNERGRRAHGVLLQSR